mgnify:FL=1
MGDAFFNEAETGLMCAERHLERAGYARFLEIRLMIEGDQLQTVLPPREELIGNVNLPALHGGVLGSLLDVTASLALVYHAVLTNPPRLVNIDVDYLRTGRVLQTFGAAEVVRMGRRAANVRARLWQDDPERPIAVARAQFLLPQRGV